MVCVRKANAKFPMSAVGMKARTTPLILVKVQCWVHQPSCRNLFLKDKAER
jgi:hypothetical protein